MSKKMLVNATQPEENRVAIVEEGILTELDVEVVGREQTKGNIYKATVVRVEQGLQAAFVDYGAERLGFLQMGEIHPSLFKAADPGETRKGKLRINDVLRRGQELLVQVVKGARGTKGAALTTHISLAGRYMVLMPDSDSKGVSRKIEEESVRKKLKATMNSLDLPEDMGYIVRTAGIDQTKEELKRDFDYLVRVYRNILALAKKAKSPALIYKESNLVIRSIRDYFTPDIDEVLVDDPKVAQEAKDFLQQVMPECVKLVKLHQEKRPIFSRYQIEEQIETISKNKVLLPSGGSIVIDRTEALVAIDVNSGKMAGETGIEATALKSNLEAADEVGRQLRLRDLGGLIVIDFIDMRDRKHNREVEKRLKESLKHDKAKVTVGKISEFGLLEMSRQRIKDALAEGNFLVCPHCEGSGRVKSAEAQAAAILRKIQAGLAKGQTGRVEAEAPLDAAIYLLNSRRQELLDMESRNHVDIIVRGRADMIAGQTEITFVRREKEDDLYLPPVTAVIEPEFKSSEESPAPPAEAAVEDGKKRRGRKKKVEEEIVATAAGVSETLAAVEAAAPLRPAEDAVKLFGSLIAESDDEEDGGDAPVDGGKKKRKRRRKKKKGGAPTAESGGESTESASAEADEEGDEEVELADGTVPATSPADEGNKKRKRKRKRKKKGGGAAAETALPAEELDRAEATAATEPSDGEPAAAEDAPARKKRKRKRKKKSPGSEVAIPEGTVLPPLAADLIASLHAEPAVEDEDPKKTARKTRRPKGSAAAEETATVAEQPSAPAADEPPPKPKRARKKATEAPATAAPPPEAAATATEEPAPAKRGRSRKTASSAAPAALPDEASPPAPAKRGRKPKAAPAE